MNFKQRLAIRYIKNRLTLLTLLHKRSGGKAAFRVFCTPVTRYKGKEAEVFANGKRLSFVLNGLQVHGYECNPGGHKTALILHGFSSSCHKFAAYATALIEKGYRVLAFDAPAHGASEGRMVNALDYKNMILEVAERYGPIDAFMAHSFGGIAVSLALEELEHEADAKLVLIAPATETTSAIEGALSFLTITHPKVREALGTHIYMVSGQPPEWFSVRRAMHQIKASVLWVHDEDDDVTPLADALKARADGHAHVQFLITKGLGHQKIYKDPATRSAILNFL